MGILKLQTPTNNYNMLITQCDLQHFYGEYVEITLGDGFVVWNQVHVFWLCQRFWLVVSMKLAIFSCSIEETITSI